MTTLSRITNFSGILDVDSTVKQLIKTESLKLDRIKQDKQITIWKQNAYRDIISRLSDLKLKYFNLTSSFNIMSKSGFQKGISTASIKGKNTDIVSVSGFNPMNSSMTIKSITQLATKDTWFGDTANLKGIKTTNINLNNIKNEGLSFILSINNNAKIIELSSDELTDVENISNLKDILNEKISYIFGSDYNNIIAETSSDQLIFDSKGNTLKMFSVPEKESLLDNMGIASGASNLDYKNKSIREIFGITNNDLINFSINGVIIETLKEDDTLDVFINKINNSNANVKLSYSEISDKFTLSSNKEGSSNNIIMNEESRNIFLKLGINGSHREEGKNAKLNIDGEDVVTDSNTLCINGLNITLNKLHNDPENPIKIETKIDTDTIIENVKNFVNDYNEIIKFLNEKFSEKRDYTITPLTDDQKKEMTENEIKLWEENAQKGLLANSTELRSLFNNLRNTFSSKVNGKSMMAYDIGITTSRNGTIELNESKLRTALETDYESTVYFLTNESDYKYEDSSNRIKRYNENGLFKKISDILEDNIRITRDSYNRKGILLELAGTKNDLSDTNNSLSRQINDYDKKIKTLNNYLMQKEIEYYNQFSTLDRILNQLYSQSLWITQVFGGNK